MEYETRFYQEAKAAGRLTHPNIVAIHDLGKSGDVAYIGIIRDRPRFHCSAALSNSNTLSLGARRTLGLSETGPE